MSHLSRRDRMFVMELVAEIASEAAGNESVVSMVEFQDQLVRTLYGTMCELLAEGVDEEDYDDEEDEEDDD